jgi:hypothetical protein
VCRQQSTCCATGRGELRELATASGDRRFAARAMPGWIEETSDT